MKNLFGMLSVFALILCMAGIAHADPRILGKQASYSAEGVMMKSYLAYDENMKGKRPGVLVVHEWWGLNDYARKRARMFA